MKRIPNLNLDELCDAYADNGVERQHFLNVTTGEIVTWFDPVVYGTDEYIEELEKKLDAGLGRTYLRIPQIESHEAYELMAEFADTISASTIRRRLERALSGRKPFRHFKDVLADYPEERERWFDFEHEAHRRQIIRWLESHGIAVDPTPQ
ncbi:UPF0158 family protein [Kyrpidia spormannii]|uniref:Uncharacterized protein n=1 Tax=Kyrpidia spormannii TaxID=2055160 RepID=A0ACA8Z513_9BACL|nr:UPF0158 family protein [Kyrpidia spormannii]CAB3389524.1 conserved protein of unknown function [Kyrpidia spormannii]